MKQNYSVSFPAFEKKCWQSFSLILLLLFTVTSVLAQVSIRVGGTVRDNKGAPIPGVSVTVKGTTKGTSTDNSGAYTIDVPLTSSVLVFSSVGYIEKQETVGDKKIINVTLADKANDLDEVVVIGYGQSIKKRDVTGSIASVSAKQIQERQPINLFDALQGQAAGVLIMNDNGEPGAQGSIQIRGTSTFVTDGNTPLYVVDGVITDNAAGINPNDIEKVEVLKDASSTAIYGARSAAGVILITTKKGKEGKPRVDVNYSKVYGWLAHKIQQANAADLRYYRRLQGGDLGNNNAGTFTDSLNPSFNSDNDLQKLLLGNTGNRDDIKIGIGGGQKGVTYYGSINYINDRGTALNTWNKSIQSRINTEFQFSQKLKYSTNLTFYWSYGNFTSINNSLRPVFDRPSYLRIWNPDGTLTSYLNSKRNPVTNALLEDNTRETLKAQMNHQVDFQIYKDLKFTAAFNAQLTSFEGFYFAPRYLDDGGNENFARNDNNRTFSWLAQGFLNYSKKIGDHSFTGLVGVEKDRDKYDFSHMEGHNFIIETVHYVRGAFIDNLTKQENKAQAASTASLFTRVGYDYKGRYIVQGTYRRDASSRFGPNAIGNFFSGSGAWRFSDEKFMNWASGWLNDGKLRLSIGTTGNDRVGYYDWRQLINQANTSYAGVPGASLSTTLGNPDLGWEETFQKNIGIDLNMIKGRIGFSADYYIKTTNNLLYNNIPPASTGYTGQKVNIGSIETTGIEFQANVVPYSSKNFTWNLSGNIAFESGIIKELAYHLPFITGSSGKPNWLIQEGGKIGNFYGWEKLGIYQYDCSNAYTKDGQKLTPVGVVVKKYVGSSPSSRKDTVTCTGYTLDGKQYTDTVYSKYTNGLKLLGGDTEFRDINNDGVIDDLDRKILGNSQPDFYFGIVNTFTYKNFTLNVIVNGTIGGKIYNSFKEGLTNNSSSNGPALPEAIYGAWTKQGDIATWPYFPDVRGDTRNSRRLGGNSYFIEDASFIRLSSAKLSYRLKSAWAKKAFMNNATLYVYGINLLTWTDYTGYDPEFSNSNALQPGDDNGKYPKRRELGLGFNLQF